jgi:hypothetical protein
MALNAKEMEALGMFDHEVMGGKLESEGKKFTNPKDAAGTAKVGVHFVPMSVVSEVGLAMLEGHRKGYGGHNYRAAGVRASVYVDAIWRHLFQQWWDLGEDIDEASELSHVTKAIACLVVLRDSMLQDNMVDDRPIRSLASMDTLNSKAAILVAKYPNPVEPFTEKGMKS